MYVCASELVVLDARYVAICGCLWEGQGRLVYVCLPIDCVCLYAYLSVCISI